MPGRGAHSLLMSGELALLYVPISGNFRERFFPALPRTLLPGSWANKGRTVMCVTCKVSRSGPEVMSREGRPSGCGYDGNLPACLKSYQTDH